MTLSDKNKKSGSRGGVAEMLIPLGVVTFLGAGGGFLAGSSVFAPMAGAKDAPANEDRTRTREAAPAAHTAAHGEAHGGAHVEANARKAPAAAKFEVKELPAIVTNLAGAGKKLIRLQSAIVYDPHELAEADTLAASLMSDITALLGTLELSTIEGPDGLRRLQEELSERAATRSERRVREFIIESVVVQ